MAALTAERRALAAERAAQLAASSRTLSNGDVEVHPAGLMALLAACSGTRTVAFGDRGCVGTRRLAALMRACRSTTAISIVIAPTTAVLRYATARSRGRITLVLHPVNADSFVVPLPAPLVIATPVIETHAPLVPPCPVGTVPASTASTRTLVATSR